MIFVLPLAPILIAVFLLIASLLIEASAIIDTVITIAWVLVIISAAFIIICNIFRRTSIGHKIIGSVICIASVVIALIVSKTFLFGLAASSDTSSFMGIIEFGFVLIFGGCIWLCSIALCATASFISLGGEDEPYVVGYLQSIGCIVGSLVIAGIFGLLG